MKHNNDEKNYADRIKEDLAIMLLKGVGSSQLIGFNPISQKIKWTELVEDKLVDYPDLYPINPYHPHRNVLLHDFHLGKLSKHTFRYGLRMFFGYVNL